MVTAVPLEPVPGVKLVMLAGKKKLFALVTVPLVVVTLMVPVVEAGTVTFTEPNAGAEKEALTPLNLPTKALIQIGAADGNAGTGRTGTGREPGRVG